MVERPLCMREVPGSIPGFSIFVNRNWVSSTVLIMYIGHGTEILKANRISVRWPIYTINSVDKTKFLYTASAPTQHHSFTVSLETTPFILLLTGMPQKTKFYYNNRHLSTKSDKTYCSKKRYE